MKKLDLNLELGDIKLAKDDPRSPAEIATDMIENIVLQYANQQKPVGLVELERRMFYKITRVFDAMIEAKATSVELDDDWLLFIKKCFKGNLMPNTLLERLEEKLAKAE